MTSRLTKNQAKYAGKVLADPCSDEADVKEARDVVDAWREAHQEVFRLVPRKLQGLAGRISSKALVVSRLKRIDTIVGKLCRPGLNMNLNQMHDIVGCRVVFDTCDQVQHMSEVLQGAFEGDGNPIVKD